MTRTTLASLALTFGVAACGGNGAEPTTVKDRLTETLPGLLSSTNGALAFIDDAETLNGIDESLATLDGAFQNLPFSLSPAAGEEDPFAGDGDVQEEEIDGAQLADELAQTIFSDANYVGNGDYRLRGEDFCGDSEGGLDPECVANFDAARVVIHVEKAGDGLDFTLGIGPDRAEPLTLELRSNRLTVAVDLAETKDAAAHLAALAGESIALPETFEGVIAASLIVNAPQNVSIQLAARTTVAIDGEFNGDRLAFSTAARDPMFGVDINAADRTLGAAIDIGPTKIEGPWESFADQTLATGNLAVDWKGLSAGVTLADGDETLTVENIGLGAGTSTISLDEFTLLSVDLNPDAGRAFDFTIAPSGDGLPILGVDPAFDLTLAFDLSPLAAAGDAVESYLLSDTYRIALSGQTPTLQPVAQNAATGFGGGLAVRSGSLSISSNDASVSVAAGQCLVNVASPEPGSHPVLGSLAAGACE